MATHSFRLALLAGVVLVCAAPGCKKRNRGTEIEGVTIMPVPEARSETGWPVYEVKNEGFAVSLPSDWRQFDMNPATFEKTFGDVIKNNPQMKELYPNLLQQIRAGIKFFGLDEATMRTGFATNANVVVVTLPGPMTADQVFDSAAAELERLPNVHRPFDRTRVRTGAGDALRLRCQMDMQLPTGNTRLALTQYVFAAPGKCYTLTLGTTAQQEAKYAETFDKIGQSFRFIK